MEIGKGQNLGFGAVLVKLQGKKNTFIPTAEGQIFTMIKSVKETFGGKFKRVGNDNKSVFKYEGKPQVENGLKEFLKSTMELLLGDLDHIEIRRTTRPEQTTKMWEEHKQWLF